ncbi:MAG TPA: TolC family protein [Bryobacteraceae bacterium]|nr:TolC family protein [Bryobacteraceae bacterium]
MNRLVHALGTLVLAAPCFGQTPATPLSLTLQDAEALAIKNHPQVQAAQLNYQASQQAVTEARAAYYPTLEGDVTGSQANPQARIGAGYLAMSRLWDRLGGGVTLSQLVTDSGRTRNLVASSRLQAQASSQTYQATRFDVLLRVNQAYFQALQAQAVVKVANETVAARQLLVDQVTSLAQNKLRSQVDVAFASVDLAQAKLMLIRAQDGVQQAFADLTRALGLDRQQMYKLNEEPLPPSPPADSVDMVTQAFKQRPELAGLRLERESAYRFERAERDLSLPTVSLIGVGGFIPYIHQLNTVPTPAEYESAAVNVEIPIFNGGLYTARREAARLKAQAADQRVRDLEESVARDVRVAWSDSLTAYHQLDVTAELLREATMALDLAQGRYNLGLSTIVELTQAQLNLTQAEVENLGAKYDYQKSYAVLQYATGMLR